MSTVAFTLYSLTHGSESLRLSPPWSEGGRGKYTGKSIFVCGGATQIGMYGELENIA